jgi:hypothetical protein
VRHCGAPLFFSIHAKIWAESGKKSSIPPRFYKKVGGIDENFIDSARNWNIGL